MSGSVAAQAPAAPQPVAPQVVPTTPAPTVGTMPSAPQLRPAPVPLPIVVEAGSGRLVQLPAPAASVMAADPRIARVQPASPTSLFVMAVAPGRTTIIATSEDGSPVAEYDVTVRPGRGVLAPQPPQPGPLEQIFGRDRRDAAPLNPAAVESAIRRSLRGMSGVRVRAAGPNTLVLNGTVANAADSQRAEAIARSFAGDDREVINNLELLSSIQVNVRVRVAEISRDITRGLGFNWQAFGQIGEFAIGLRTGQSAGRALDAILRPGVDPSLTTAPSVIGLGATGNRYDINAIIDALAQDRLLTILAEPNLTAQSGETASFLAGGEFPVPVSGSTGTGAVSISIEFKTFGVSLAFVPTVLGPDRLNLRIRPEVSELSETGAVNLPLAGGVVRIPGLTVRRAETTVELGSGQSFAIAGLLTRRTSQSDHGVIGLAEIPVLGALFRSDRFLRGETELVIIVTPYLVRPVSDPRQLALPTDGFRAAVDLDRVLFQRQIARGAVMPPLRGRPDAGFILE
ncbi:type II and III secretion system protein family protein [Caldovatus aquaticus]|uniref:Type II and III secretion system protein family protein n=1 Tax=Caldovatus aquaticus TaxID=2865671 RepID=A0ABS7F0D3_9PROT|nr:type II and III secretion system protein family protein [Caldovatus aquaticus]MBW8269082.1 type II and III secretion system protein family protein [Caldovatus aquaticus]